MDWQTLKEVLDWLLDAGGLWVAIAVLFVDNRRLWGKLTELIDERLSK